MKVEVVDINGKNTGRKVELSDAIFAIEPNDHAIYLDVKQHLANKRQGTHKAKERADIKGSTRKIKKQKGTGTARAGSIKSPIFRGGGRVFGPRPRSYAFKLNKGLKQLARQSALSLMAKGDNIVEQFAKFYARGATHSQPRLIPNSDVELTEKLLDKIVSLCSTGITPNKDGPNAFLRQIK